MRRRATPLASGHTAKWFSATIGEHGEHVFRVPRWAVMSELMAVLNLTHSGRDPEALRAGAIGFDADTTTEVRASMDATGAAIGAFWRHPLLELVVDRQSFDSTPSGVRRYGDAVLDELDDSGYSEADVAEIIEAITPRLISGLFPVDDPEVSRRAATFLDS